MDGFASFEDMIDFSSVLDTVSFDDKQEQTHNKPPIPNNLYKQKYSHATLEYYKAMRIRVMDPITITELNPSHAFEFKNMWDPYTGERLEHDPYGSLWFDPNILIKFYYTNRVNQLWAEPIDEHNGYYEGYYADAVGRGNDIYIQSRGYHPERYLFRLPIHDCYLTTDHNDAVITMGPLLSDDDVKRIDYLASLPGETYRRSYGKKRPTLATIKFLYEQAVSMTSIIEMPEVPLGAVEMQSLYDKANRLAVDKLRAMHG